MTRLQWPYPGDSPVARARKVAGAYRSLAQEQAAALAQCATVLDAVDRRLVAFKDPAVLSQIDACVKALSALTPPEALDTRFREWGEGWHADIPVHYEQDDWVTAKEAAPIVGLNKGTLGQLRIRGRIKGKWDKNLGSRGGWRYRVGDLWKLSTEKRGRDWRARERTDSITTDGSSDPE